MSNNHRDFILNHQVRKKFSTSHNLSTSFRKKLRNPSNLILILFFVCRSPIARLIKLVNDLRMSSQCILSIWRNCHYFLQQLQKLNDIFYVLIFLFIYIFIFKVFALYKVFVCIRFSFYLRNINLFIVLFILLINYFQTASFFKMSH
jgi:hypothetical protein